MTTAEKKRNDARFHGIDLLLTLFAMAALLFVIWQVLSGYEQTLERKTTVLCTLVAENIPEAAIDSVKKDEMLYAADGSVIGKVSYVSYPRQDGRTPRMILKLETDAERHYGGYLSGATLLTVGERYAIHTRNFGGSAVCYEMEETVK